MGNTPPQGGVPSFPPPPNLRTQWDLRYANLLIQKKQLAPFFPYVKDEDATIDAEECPICLNYVVGGLNQSTCCSKGVCTPCYLMIKKTPQTPIGCPFCLGPVLVVKYKGPKTQEQITTELEDARKVDALRKQIRQEEIEADRLREEKRRKEKEDAQARSLARNLEARGSQNGASVHILAPTPVSSPVTPSNIPSPTSNGFSSVVTSPNSSTTTPSKPIKEGEIDFQNLEDVFAVLTDPSTSPTTRMLAEEAADILLALSMEDASLNSPES